MGTHIARSQPASVRTAGSCRMLCALTLHHRYMVRDKVQHQQNGLLAGVQMRIRST